MSDKVFGDYAQHYDRLYQDKDYAGEVALLRTLIKEYAPQAKRILDLGCGTGGHAIPLAKAGFQVTGVDLSDGMLARAREKAAQASVSLDLHQGDVRQLRVPGTYDVALLMFAVLGYQTTNEDVFATLRGIRDRLRPGGLLVFDVWYGPAVLTERPTQRVREIREDDGGETIRISTPTLDIERQTCAVEFRVLRLRDGRIGSDTRERHIMRYFFPLEIEILLREAGFNVYEKSRFPERSALGDKTWNALVVAEAR